MQKTENYKQTEVGLIPEDWEVMEFGEICSPTKVKFNPLHSDNRPCVELEDLSQETGRLLSLSDSINKASLKTIFSAGDVLFGKLRPYLRKYYFADFDGVCSTEIWALSSKPKIHSRFVFYQVQTNRIMDSANISTGTKMPRAEWKTVAETKIPLPPLPEQTAIASALSDMDALITQTEKLVEKKKAIKQGVMQELLTGKKRLKGFENSKGYKQTEVGLIPEDWEVLSIDNIFDFYSTSNYSKAEMSLEGEVGCIHYGLIHAISDTSYNLQRGIKFFIKPEQAKYEEIMDGDVVMVDASEDMEGVNKSIEVFGVNNKRFIAGLHTYLLRDNKLRLANNFRGAILNSSLIKTQLNRLAVGMKVFGVSKPQLKTVLIPVPPLPEQTAIASALSDIDEDIRIRETKLQKLKLQKQGMMQALLTGKIRLV